MDLITIFDSNGQEIDMAGLGLMGMKLLIPSPSYKTSTQEIDGQSGSIVVDRVLDQRKLTAHFVSKAKDYYDSLTLRDTLYGLLGNGKMIYVSESKQPTKRWKVYLDEWTPERFNTKIHVFEIPMTCPSGASESISPVTKRFSSIRFRFNNEGNQIIDPRVHSETEIELSGASTNPTIRNLTTGEEWKLTGTTIVSDKILLKGVRSLKNGVSVFKQTNKKLITLVPGWNEFEILGVTEGAFGLTVRTRFYFL